MNSSNFKHVIPIQIRFSDTDMIGHVNNTAFQQFYDNGKIRYFNAVLGKHDWENTALVLVSLTINFMGQLYLESNISVRTRTIEIGNKSLILEQQIVDNNSGEIKSVCKATLVCFSQKLNESVQIPSEWIEKICVYDKGVKMKYPKISLF
jgi:acyl-CoA thioester hydrolase